MLQLPSLKIFWIVSHKQLQGPKNRMERKEKIFIIKGKVLRSMLPQGNKGALSYKRYAVCHYPATRSLCRNSLPLIYIHKYVCFPVHRIYQQYIVNGSVFGIQQFPSFPSLLLLLIEINRSKDDRKFTGKGSRPTPPSAFIYSLTSVIYT